jgi:hypothetical protein
MVKSGKFTVQQPSIAGRIGSGIGQGLAESLPKEMERGRLAAGLKQFEQEAPGLSPLQQYSRLVPLLSGSPHGAQALQTIPEILKQERLRQSYRNKRPSQQEPIEQPNLISGSIGSQGNYPNQFPNENQDIVQPTERGQPQIVESNPLREEVIPRKRWSNDRFEDEVGRILDERPDLTINEAIDQAKQREERYLSEPESVRRQDDYFREQQKLADDSLNKRLETLLQKEGKDIYSDISGEYLNNLRRGMYRDLRTNPDSTLEDVVNSWAQKGLDLAKNKKQLETLASKNILSKITHGSEYKDKLDTYAKIFAETGNQQEFYHSLIDKFEMSPQGAASIAYPRSKRLKEYISKPVKFNPSDIGKAPSNSRKYAVDIQNLITGKDSLLAIARDLKEKDPLFDQRAFFNQLREDMDTAGFTPRQRTEIAEGESGFTPTWGDILLLPIFRGFK